MNIELILLDKLTSLKIEPKDIKIVIDLINQIDWNIFFKYLLISKTVCIAYNCLVINHLEQYIPAKIYKIMSQIFLGNQIHNKIILEEITFLNQAFIENNINCFQYKNLIDVYTGFEKYQMPNDIDFIAPLKDFEKLQNVLIKNNYEVKNIKKDTSSLFCSAFFVKLNSPQFFYPLKVDVVFNLGIPINFDEMLFDFWAANDQNEKNAFLMIFNIIEVLKNNENFILNISDFFKIKRLYTQYLRLNHITLLYIKIISEKYKIEYYINKIVYIFENFLNLFSDS